MDGDVNIIEEDTRCIDPVKEKTLDYAVVDRCPRTGWGTVFFFSWATETLRHVHERLSGELNFAIYDLDKEDKVGLGELANTAQQEKMFQELLSKTLVSDL